MQGQNAAGARRLGHIVRYMHDRAAIAHQPV
jgi:hypothetical protein